MILKGIHKMKYTDEFSSCFSREEFLMDVFSKKKKGTIR